MICSMKKQELAKQDYLAGMKYKDIAAKHGVSLNTVKSWKARYWNKDPKVATKPRNGATKRKKVATRKKPPNSNELKAEYKLFAGYYLQRFNATWAYMQVYGCNYSSVATSINQILFIT